MLSLLESTKVSKNELRTNWFLHEESANSSQKSAKNDPKSEEIIWAADLQIRNPRYRA
jgi:hypothetical protein